MEIKSILILLSPVVDLNKKQYLISISCRILQALYYSRLYSVVLVRFDGSRRNVVRIPLHLRKYLKKASESSHGVVYLHTLAKVASGEQHHGHHNQRIMTEQLGKVYKKK